MEITKEQMQQRITHPLNDIELAALEYLSRIAAEDAAKPETVYSGRRAVYDLTSKLTHLLLDNLIAAGLVEVDAYGYCCATEAGLAAWKAIEAQTVPTVRPQSDASAQTLADLNALMNVLTGLHVMLNKAGIPQEGSLTERLQAALERMKRAEDGHLSLGQVTEDTYNAIWDIVRPDPLSWDYPAQITRYVEMLAGRRAGWKAAAKVFRRRWLDAVAEAEGAEKSWDNERPARKIVAWLRAVQLEPEGIYETSDDYTIYASFSEPIERATFRVLSGLNLEVSPTPIRNRYKVTFVPSPDDEV